MKSTDVETFTKTMSQNGCDVDGYDNTIPHDTDWKTHYQSSSPQFLNAENHETGCMNDGKQEVDSCDVLLMKSSPSEGMGNVTSGLNKEACFPSKAEGCPEDVQESHTTETSNSIVALPQPTMQMLSPAGYNLTETDSSSPSITNTRDSSAGYHSTMAYVNPAAGLQASGPDNRSAGARPKLIASRTLKKNSRPKNKHKHVTFSSEKKYVTCVDDVTYDQYRNCISNLPLPHTSRTSAAAKAVLFMHGKDEQISPALIDIAMKCLWVKLGSCPKAVPLYSAISEFNCDERSFVLEFLELCQTEPSMTTANALFGNIQTLLSVPVKMNPASQHITDESDNIPSQISSSTPEKQNVSHSSTDNISVTNLWQQTSQVLTDEPLKALDFHIPQLVPHSQEENIQLPCEANHPVSHIHHANVITDSVTSRVSLSQAQMRHLQIQALKREQEYLKKTLTCVLCKNKPAEVTLLPCGHFVLCAACSDECNICPVCSKEALAEVKTFLC